MAHQPAPYHLQNLPDREISDPKAVQELLKAGKYVVIALCHNNEPYVVTLSYGYDEQNNTMYFHGSRKGMKLDFIREHPAVCATLIEDHGYVPEQCSHNYKTLIIRGRMELVTELEEKRKGMDVMLGHLEKEPTSIQKLKLKSEAMYEHFSILKLSITQITGKAGLG